MAVRAEAEGLVHAPVAQLHESAENPREIPEDRFEDLKRSLAHDPDMLEARPVIATLDGEVVCGNMRLRAAVELGFETIPTYFKDLDEVRRREWMIRDNQEYGDWVPDQLAEIITRQRDSGADLSMLGFSGGEVDRLLGSILEREQEEKPEEEPIVVPPEPITQPGDLVRLGDHLLLCGDATVRADAHKLVAGQGEASQKLARLCFTSPPYADARDYSGEGNLEVDHLASFFEAWRAYAGIFCVNLGLLRRQNMVLPYWNAYIERAQKEGLGLLSWNVWNREHPYAVSQHTAMFPIEHEWVLVFGEKPVKLNPTVPTVTGEKLKARKTGRNRKTDGSLGGKASPWFIRNHRELGTVYTHPPELGGRDDLDHPAPFPVDLPKAYIEALTDRGDLVVDPFLGSGTTIIACEDLGRRCLGVELDPRFCDVAITRFERYSGLKAER